MEWIQHLNATVDYIEEHLTEDLSYEQIAQVACCSTYHFQRMFAYLSDMPLSEYLRRRRMTLAAVDLQSGAEKIVDLALKYGYQSPTAFNRAFQSVHGIAPSLVREQHAAVKSFSPIRFQMTIKGAEEMNYRVEEKPAFRIVGVSVPLKKEIEENFETIPGVWQRVCEDGTIQILSGMMDTDLKAVLGVSACGEQEQWRYYVSVASTQPLKEGLEEYTIPAATWAIFPGRGTNLSIQTLLKRIVTEWFPTSGYEYTNAPDVEVYLNPDPNDTQYEVWVPVIKK